MIPLRKGLSEDPDINLLFFHNSGQFLGPIFKQELFEIKLKDYTSSNTFVALNLKHVKTLLSDENHCTYELEGFEACVRTKALSLTL